MKIIENDLIPGGGFKAINLFGYVFHRRMALPLTKANITHEAIHSEQMKELLYIPFYILYGIEWLVKFFYYWNGHKAYKAISFEREANYGQYDESYLKNRKKYCWIKYIKQ